MNARDDILAGLRASEDSAIGDATPEQIVNAFEAAVLRKASDDLSSRVQRWDGMSDWAESMMSERQAIADHLRRKADEAEGRDQ